MRWILPDVPRHDRPEHLVLQRTECDEGCDGRGTSPICAPLPPQKKPKPLSRTLFLSAQGAWTFPPRLPVASRQQHHCPGYVLPAVGRKPPVVDCGPTARSTGTGALCDRVRLVSCGGGGGGGGAAWARARGRGPPNGCRGSPPVAVRQRTASTVSWCRMGGPREVWFGVRTLPRGGGSDAKTQFVHRRSASDLGRLSKSRFFCGRLFLMRAGGSPAAGQGPKCPNRPALHCPSDTHNQGTELAMKVVRQAQLELSGGSTPDLLRPPKGL